MSYKTGQFSRGRLALGDYKSDIAFAYAEELINGYRINNQKIGGSSYGTSILLPESHLEKGYSYYLNFTVAKQNGKKIDWNFTIKAYSKEGLSQPLKNITFIGSETHDTATYELIFTPKINVSEIRFEIERNAEDEGLTYDGGFIGKYANIIIHNFFTVSNILQYDILPKTLQKLEIKSMAGLLMAINGEEIHVGRRNTYELNYDKFQVTSLGFVLKPSEYYLDGYEYFIMNYQYKEDII